MDDESEILFDRYDHFLEEYECYDFNTVTPKNNSYIIELTRKKDKDDTIIEEDDYEDDSSDEIEKIDTEEMWDDMIDEGFVANL